MQSAVASAAPIRALNTTDAARYLGISVSLLRKLRLKGLDDPGLKGPQYYKVGSQIVLYEVTALDAWLDQHRAA
jgi:hypothetical protein